jgi:hypothetical protein
MMSRATTLVGLATGCLLVGGCNSPREFAEVEGTVTVDGKPLTNVEVVFLPDPFAGNPGNNSSAYTDAQGRYRLRSAKDGRDGTVLGPHRVVFVDLTNIPNLTGAPPAQLGFDPPAPGRPKPPRFLPAYASSTDTPFKDVDVKPGKQTMDFDLKGPRR